MTLEALSPQEFASLLTVGKRRREQRRPYDTRRPHRPIDRMGYLVQLAGRLRMTILGRYRIYAEHLSAR